MQTILDTNTMILRMTMARDSMLSTKSYGIQEEVGSDRWYLKDAIS